MFGVVACDAADGVSPDEVEVDVVLELADPPPADSWLFNRIAYAVAGDRVRGDAARGENVTMLCRDDDDVLVVEEEFEGAELVDKAGDVMPAVLWLSSEEAAADGNMAFGKGLGYMKP